MKFITLILFTILGNTLILPLIGETKESKNFYLGAGAGFHSYDEKSPLRGKTLANNQQEENTQKGYLKQYYLEWYFIEHLGIGWRQTEIKSSRKDRARNNREQYEQHIISVYQTYTLQWKVFTLIESLGVNLGLLLGFGTGDYEYQEKFTNPTESSSNYDRNTIVHGGTSLNGIFIDNRNSLFGIRLEFLTYQPNFESMTVGGTTYDLKPSGTATTLSFHIAF